MVKDKRFKTVKLLIEGGHIPEFKDIFEHIPRTAVAKEMGIHYDRFKKMITDPAEFKVKELYTLAGMIGVDGKILLDLVHAQHIKRRKK